MPWDLLGPASSPPSNVDVSPRPGTMHYQSPSPRSLSSLTAIEVRSTCHLIGCRSEDFNYQISLEPCPHEPSIHYWAHYRLAIRARHHRAKCRKFDSLYMELEPQKIMVPGEIAKKSKFPKIFFCPNRGHRGSIRVNWGHLRSFKVTKGHFNNQNCVKNDYFTVLK